MTTLETIIVISCLILIGVALTLYLLVNAAVDHYEPHTRDLAPDETEYWFWGLMVLIALIGTGCLVYIVNEFLNKTL